MNRVTAQNFMTIVGTAASKILSGGLLQKNPSLSGDLHCVGACSTAQGCTPLAVKQ